jgi:hypothetical protein
METSSIALLRARRPRKQINQESKMLAKYWLVRAYLYL